MTSSHHAFGARSWGIGFEELARWTLRSTASIQIFPIPSKAAGARPDDSCALSLPYTVQISHMNLVSGTTVKAGEEIAEVISPEQDSIVATYMRALADIAGRTAELRIKARVAQESLESARSYMRVTEEAAQHVDTMSAATVTFRMEVLRERAAARKAVVSQEAEVAESAIQLASLDEFIQQLRGRLDDVERDFHKGRVFAPIAGIVSTGLAHAGHRWWRALRSRKSSIRPISLWTGTFPTCA
jgi:hypothetical protein